MVKNKRVVLISPPSQITGARPYYPRFCEAMGLSYLSKELSEGGYDPLVLDAEVHGLSKSDLLERVKQGSPPLVVGIAALSKVTLGDATNIASLFRAYGIKSHITFGGHLATFVHDKMLEKYPKIDSVVRGEGEKTLVELVKSVENAMPLEGVEGISFRKNRKVIVNKKRELISNLNNEPFPKRYNLRGIINAGQRVPVCSSRGCYGGCSFCTLAFFSKKWRARSPENVVDEISTLYEEGARRFRFDDENFFGHCEEGLKRAVELSEEILKRRFHEPIGFKVLCRVDDLNEGVLLRLKQSGLDKVSVGIESFNQRQLDFYNKGITPEQIKRAIEMIRRVGIDANFSFIMFDPYTTLDEVSNNLTNIGRLPEFFEYRRLTSILKPDIGTVITNRLERKGLLEERSEFDYDIKFVHPETALLWRVIREYATRFLPVDDKVTGVKDERLDLVVYKSREGLSDPREKQCLKKITEAERQMYFGWIEVIKHGIEIAKRYKRFEDVKDLFPEAIDRRFRTSSILLDEARDRLYKK